jgi:hypothetical protein
MPGPGFGGYPPQPGSPPQAPPGFPANAVRYGGYTANGVPMRLKHSPGPGLIVGLFGVAALLLSYFALPWISEGGQDVSFKDIREAFHPDESSATALDPGMTVTTSLEPSLTVPTTDPGLPPLNTVTPPLPAPGDTGDLGQVVTPTVTPAYDGAANELEAYTDWGWTTVLYLSIAAVVSATLLVPRDRAGRLVTGTLTVPCLGWVNLFDREGSSAPRVLAGLASIFVVLEVIGNAHNLFWDKPGSPDPAIGAWLGVVGSVAVLAASIMGTKRTWVPDHG